MAKKKLSFKSFNDGHLILLHRALKEFIEGGSGYGFHNHDMGHPAYVMGADGEIDFAAWGDNPERNELYQLLKGIHEEMKSRKLNEEIKYRFDSWQNFCKFAVKVYRARRGK